MARTLHPRPFISGSLGTLLRSPLSTYVTHLRLFGWLAVPLQSVVKVDLDRDQLLPIEDQADGFAHSPQGLGPGERIVRSTLVDDLRRHQRDPARDHRQNAGL